MKLIFVYTIIKDSSLEIRKTKFKTISSFKTNSLLNIISIDL